jgi:FkbM family methyltransferase
VSDTHPVEILSSKDCEREILAQSYTLCPVRGQTYSIYLDSEAGDEISSAIAGGTYGFPFEFYLLPELVEPGQRVLDLGAHIGTFSLFAATLGYPVVSVEASPRNAALLRHSARKNGFTALRVVQVAVSDQAGELEFIQAGPYSLVSNPGMSNPTISVSAVTVDKLLDDVGWDRVDFVKMDIEGSEVAALRGMSRLLSREDAPAILYESNGYTLNLFGETPAYLMACLEEYGYSCYLVDSDRLVRSRPGELQAEVCVNYLATKRPLNTRISRRIAPPMSSRDRAIKVLSSSIGPNVHARAHIARALSQAEPLILSDRRVVNALRVLMTDSDSSVRAAAAWWQEHESYRDRTSLFHRPRPQVHEANRDEIASRLQVHQRYKAILKRDLKIARLNRWANRSVRSLPGLYRCVLRAVWARLKLG